MKQVSCWLVLAGLVASSAPAGAQSPERAVAGRVLDARTGAPVTAGEVRVRGLDRVDHLRPDGVFVLRVPPGAVTLAVHAAGYEMRELEVGPNEGTLVVALEPKAVRLVGVTVLEAAPGRATLASDDLNRVPASGFTETLRGRIAGAEVTSAASIPGGDFALTVRGVTTILGNRHPLYVLDGVVMSDAAIGSGVEAVTGGQPPVPSRIADLNPADIARVEVLRGAAATSRYGSLGANGVIVVTTRHGSRP